MSLFKELQRRNVMKMTVVYVLAGWVLLQVADIVIPALGIPEWGVTFVLVLIALGFPIALIFSWVYEITPEGIRKEKDIAPGESITHETSAKLNYLVVGLLVVIAALLAFNLFGTRGLKTESAVIAVSEPDTATAVDSPVSPGEGLTSVAVLPFVNMSADPDNEYFSDGISEELLNVLVKVKGLRVPSRTSSFAFKGEGKPIAEIAAILKVDHVLEGSVRKAGNTVRVTAQLIDVGTDTHLWSETYDRELTDIFAIQDEIANSIVRALQATLGTEVPAIAESRPTESLEAYELYLRGRFFLRLREQENLRRSIELFKQAVELDPEFAQAWSGLAAAYNVLPGYMTSDPGVYGLAREAANEALVLDGSLGEARAVLAQLLGVEGKFDDALRTFEKALEIAPRDSTARLWYGIQLFQSGYLRQAGEQLAIAKELDPASGLHLGWLGRTQDVLGHQEQALETFQQGMALGRRAAFKQALLILVHQGRYDEARELVSSGALDQNLGGRANFLFIEAVENPDKVSEAIAALEATGQFVSSQYLFLGDTDRGLENIIEIGAFNNTAYAYFWYPYAKALRQQPAFREFIEQHGFLAVWRERGWPDLCHPVGDSFECD
ncbi:MAG: tetratricopeptide repeat protein [Gammaproteobacteria bacterium]|nr:MAG: tetratricopeptide repeat protein [Gammaproteobacteria bacterium]